MSATLAQTEAKIDSFVEGNIKPWLNARVADATAEAYSLRGDAEKWRELMERVEGGESWTASDIETHYGMLFGRPFGGPAHLPRVITADQLREGQTIAAYCIEDGSTDLMAVLGVVESTNGRDVTLRDDCAGSRYWYNIAHEGITIVLLADAPEDETVTAEDIRNSEPGSTWEDAHGHASEWDGEHLCLQAGDRLVAIDQLHSHVFNAFGPWVRSNKPSIGTYEPDGGVTVR